MPKSQATSTKPLGSILDELVRVLGIHPKLQEYQAVERWAEVVGDHVAHAAKATSIIRGVLSVRVESSTWRSELMFRKREIVDKLNAALGEQIVKDIKYH